MNRYDIKRSLGEGRLGKVYLAEDNVIGRYVILRKFLIPENVERAVFEKNFLSLVRDLASIEDASILPILDAGIVGDTAFIVSASASGDIIQNMLGYSSFDVWDVYCLAQQLLEALGKLSKYGFFHYHFRLSSILVQKKANGGKHFLLMDMGYSKLMELIHGGSSDIDMISPVFAAPELCAGKPVGEVTSLFMVGQLCYAMLAGGHPLSGLPIEVAKAKHRVGELPYISGFRGDVPEGFKAWMYQLMSPSWKDRPQSVKEALAMMPSERVFSAESVKKDIEPQPFPVALEFC